MEGLSADSADDSVLVDFSALLEDFFEPLLLFVDGLPVVSAEDSSLLVPGVASCPL